MVGFISIFILSNMLLKDSDFAQVCCDHKGISDVKSVLLLDIHVFYLKTNLVNTLMD